MNITSLSRRIPRYRAWTEPLSLTYKISTNWHRRGEPRIVTPPENSSERGAPSSGLARHLGLFGTTMAVMGGIIGAGIFINPYLVAERVHTSFLILAVWIAGGMAAVAVTFARYFLELTHWPVNDSLIAACALAILTAINCLGVRAGSRVQSAMTLTAIAAIGVLELFSFLRGGPSQISFHPLLDQPPSLSLALAFGSAMTPVLFAYGGWQTSSFLGGEVRDPRKTLPRGLVLGVLGVIAVYASVNFVYVRALGPV